MIKIGLSIMAGIQSTVKDPSKLRARALISVFSSAIVEVIPAEGDFLLKEDGDFLLLETGDKIIL